MTLIQSIRFAVRGQRRLASIATACTLLPFMHSVALAAGEEELTEVVVQGDRMNVMQTQPVDSVFGFGKRVDETPRAITTISNELLEQTIITEIDDLVALTPGSFTQSFFGVAGSLDVRGTPGENYFRGMKRIDNPGNYPTAIGASDHIDVVRGPASPIYGPSKIGGYMNFVPKSARATNGKYIEDATGQIGLTTGSYGKRVINAEVGGPLSLAGKEGGYYLYGESENSGSYYENTSTEQSILQGSADFQLSENWHTEFGGMYQYYKGNQVAGWNRLTQALIDHGTYISGSPPSLDADHNGYLSGTESLNGLFAFYPFETPGPNMALVNPGIAHIKRSQVLVQDDDTLQDHDAVLYFDLIGELAGGLKVQNKVFFETLDNLNENAYGFSQYANTYVLEDQLNFQFSKEFTDVKTDFQFGPSIRYSDFEHGDNFAFEYFDRRDLSLGPDGGSPIDRREWATRPRDGVQEDWSTHTWGHFVDYGFAFLSDITFFKKLDLLTGARYDALDMSSVAGLNSASSDYATVKGQRFTDTDHGLSWTASLSYDLYGVRPYATLARQSTMVLGQGGQIPTNLLAAGNDIGKSKLDEYGVKTTTLGGRLYLGLDYFKQQRTDYNAQDTVTNNSTESKGIEAELRWVATDFLTVTSAYSNLKIYNLGPSADAQFSFMGAEDLIKVGIDPTTVFGGTMGWDVPTPNHRKAGIPANIYSLNMLLNFGEWIHGLTGTLSGTHVDSVYSGYSQAVKLPSYTLVNAGLRYAAGKWAVGVQSKNLTNERYFRSNFPDLFGSSVVLPEVPRTFLFTADYKF